MVFDSPETPQQLRSMLRREAEDAATWREVEPLLIAWIQTGHDHRLSRPGSLRTKAEANGNLEQWIEENLNWRQEEAATTEGEVTMTDPTDD